MLIKLLVNLACAIGLFGKVLVAGEVGWLGGPAQAEAGDPWEAKPGLIARYRPSVGFVGGTLFIVGGESYDGKPHSIVEAYDIASGTISTRRPIPTARTNFGIGVVNGRLYAIGGVGHSGVLGSVEEYDPIADSWRTRASLHEPRAGLSVGVVKGIIYAAGGTDGKSYSKTVEAYDPNTDRWVKKNSLLVPVETRESMAVVNNSLYLLGGRNENCFNHVQRYRQETDDWELDSALPRGSCKVSAAVAGGRIYGFTSDRVSHGILMVQEPPSKDWIANGLRVSKPASKFGIAAHNGLIYLVAGEHLAGIRVYDPKLDFETMALKPFGGDRPVVRKISGASANSDVEDAGEPRSPHPFDFALIVGIEKYKSVGAAEFAEGDARTVKQYAKTILGIPEENIISLLGANARKADIAKYVEEWLPRNVGPRSRVYVYFSGHGAPDPVKGSAYLVPWDGDPAFLPSSAYPISRLYEKLDDLKAREVIVALDACFSGQGGRSVIAKGIRPLVNVLDVSFRPQSRLSILAASKNSEIAGSADAKGHGLFTYYFLKGLRGDADSSRDGHLNLRELHSYVHDNVRREAGRQNRDQTPQMHSASEDLEFY